MSTSPVTRISIEMADGSAQVLDLPPGVLEVGLEVYARFEGERDRLLLSARPKEQQGTRRDVPAPPKFQIGDRVQIHRPEFPRYGEIVSIPDVPATYGVFCDRDCDISYEVAADLTPAPPEVP